MDYKIFGWVKYKFKTKSHHRYNNIIIFHILNLTLLHTSGVVHSRLHLKSGQIRPVLTAIIIKLSMSSTAPHSKLFKLKYHHYIIITIITSLHFNSIMK